MGAVRRAVLILVAVIVADGVLVAQGQKAQPVRDQTLFSEEGTLQNQVALSPNILKILLKTRQARQGMQFASDAEENKPAELFRAAEVHLGRRDEVDLVVIGVPPMSGADNGWFWLVSSATSNHPKVVLFAGGNSLEIMESRTNGYRDIKSIWSSPNETSQRIYHFDGKSYRLWKEKWTPTRY